MTEHVLLSLGYRGRGYADGYRLFKTKEELLKYVENMLLEAGEYKDLYDAMSNVEYYASIIEYAHDTYSIFLVNGNESKGVKREYKKDIDQLIKNHKWASRV